MTNQCGYRHTDIPEEQCWLRATDWCLAYDVAASTSELPGKNSLSYTQGDFNPATFPATPKMSEIEFAETVQKFIEKVDRILPTAGLPTPIEKNSQAALAELRDALSDKVPDAMRIRRSLESLQHAMEPAGRHVMATTILTVIKGLLYRSVGTYRFEH